MKMFLWCLLIYGIPALVHCQEWISDSYGNVPQYAFVGGDENGSPTYVCKYSYFGEPGSGKVNRYLGRCGVEWNGKAYSNVHYEVLTNPPWATYTLRWETGYGKGNVPPDTVSIGAGIYVGRYKRDGHYIPGKIVTEDNGFFYTYEGKRYWAKKGYEPLVMKRRPISGYEVYDVVYDLDSATETILPDIQFVTQKEVKNASPYPMSSKVSLDYTKTSSHSWTMRGSYKLEKGKSTSVKAGIPRLSLGAQHSWYEDEKYTYAFKYGEDFTHTIKTSHEVTVRQPPFSDLYVSMTYKEAVVNVPFVATVKIKFSDGATYTFYNVPGVYDDIHQSLFETHIDDVLPTDETAEPTA